MDGQAERPTERERRSQRSSTGGARQRGVLIAPLRDHLPEAQRSEPIPLPPSIAQAVTGNCRPHGYGLAVVRRVNGVPEPHDGAIPEQPNKSGNFAGQFPSLCLAMRRHPNQSRNPGRIMKRTIIAAAAVVLALAPNSFGQAIPPNLSAASTAPAGMEIVTDGLTLRLANPTVQFKPYALKTAPSILYAPKIWALVVYITTEIKPSKAPEYTDIFGTKWYYVPESAGPARLLKAGQLTALLPTASVGQPYSAVLGDIRMTALRLTRVTETDGRLLLVYRFDLAADARSGTPTGTTTLTQFQKSFELRVASSGTDMTELTDLGYVGTASVLSPIGFRVTGSGSLETGQSYDQSSPLFCRIWGQSTTFALDGWNAVPNGTTTTFSQQVATNWNRAFTNVVQYCRDASLTSATPALGYHPSISGLLPVAPFFLNAATVINNVDEVAGLVAPYINRDQPFNSTENFIFHAAPSPALPTGGGDTSTPTVIITNPASDGTTVSSASLNVTGTASDNVGVTLVQVRLNGGSWFNAAGTGNWSIGLLLASGLNVIEAQARDAAGNLSNIARRQVSFQLAPTSYTVTPSAGPNGAISPNTPRTVSPGGSVTFTAIPANGYVVDRWFANGQLLTQIPEGSTSATLTNIRANHTVHVTFKLIPLPKVSFAPNSIITIQAVVNAKLVTAEASGQQPLIANRTFRGSWEQFQVIDMGNGTFALKSLSNGKFVSAENAGASPLIANRDVPGAWEQFRAVDIGKGIFALIASVNEKYVCADSAGNGPLIANRSVAGLWEHFRIIYPASVQPVTVITSLQAGSTGSYVCAESAGTGALVANRSVLSAWEQFQFVDLNNGNVAIKARINNRFITAESAGAGPLIANRTAVALWEQFQIFDAGVGYVALKSLVNGQYVSTNSATGVLQAKSYFVGATERFALNVVLTSQANGAFVCAENGGNSPLIANRGFIGGWEQFQFVNTGNGNIALKSLANGRYVCAENGGASPLIANRTVINAWEQFQWIVGGNGRIALKALANGRFVTAENAGRDPLIANRTMAMDWEQFR